jgi:hypothetical protein
MSSENNDDSSQLPALYQELLNGVPVEKLRYIRFDKALVESRGLSRDQIEKWSPTIDLNNLRFIQRLSRMHKAFHEDAILSAEMEGLEAYKKVCMIGKDLGEAFLRLSELVTKEVPEIIDMLVREKRVQEIPAKRIKRAIELAVEIGKDNREKIRREISVFDKLGSLTGYFVLAVSKYNDPDPSLQKLFEVSGHSRSDWSKNLSHTPALLLNIRNELQKKYRQAKAEHTKNLWLEAYRNIEEKMLRYDEREHKRKKMISIDRLDHEDLYAKMSPEEQDESDYLDRQIASRKR